MRFINSLYKHSWQSVENLKILGVYKNGLCHKGTSLCCQMCLQQVLEGVMHNDSSSSLSVGLSDSKRCLRADPHSKLIRSCWSNGVAWCECIWGLWCAWHFSWHVAAAQPSLIVLMMSWKVFVPSPVSAAHLGFNRCGQPCLDRPPQGVPSAGSSAPLWALHTFLGVGW